MNRQPFLPQNYYDEDLDGRVDMGHGITMVRLCRHTTKKVTKWDMNLYDFANGRWAGVVTKRNGRFNLYTHNHARFQSAEVKGLGTEAEVFAAAPLLIKVIFS